MGLLSVQRVNHSNRQAFLALSQNYEAEFSKITGKLPDSTGQYQITDVEDGHYEGWVCHSGDQIIGFAVIDIARKRFDVAEFYIIPTHRRNALGKSFAHHLFDHYHGQWQVRQIMGAEHARAFWVDAINSYSSGNFTNSKEKDPEWGEVYIQTFESRLRGPQ